MFFYNSIAKTDCLLRTLKDLKDFYNVNLYTQNNFTELNKLITDLMTNQLVYEEYTKNDSKVVEIQARNVSTDKNIISASAKENIRNYELKINYKKKTPFYYFKNYPIEANY